MRVAAYEWGRGTRPRTHADQPRTASVGPGVTEGTLAAPPCHSTMTRRGHSASRRGHWRPLRDRPFPPPRSPLPPTPPIPPLYPPPSSPAEIPSRLLSRREGCRERDKDRRSSFYARRRFGRAPSALRAPGGREEESSGDPEGGPPPHRAPPPGERGPDRGRGSGKDGMRAHRPAPSLPFGPGAPGARWRTFGGRGGAGGRAGSGVALQAALSASEQVFSSLPSSPRGDDGGGTCPGRGPGAPWTDDHPRLRVLAWVGVRKALRMAPARSGPAGPRAQPAPTTPSPRSAGPAGRGADYAPVDTSLHKRGVAAGGRCGRRGTTGDV